MSRIRCLEKGFKLLTIKRSISGFRLTSSSASSQDPNESTVSKDCSLTSTSQPKVFDKLPKLDMDDHDLFVAYNKTIDAIKPFSTKFNAEDMDELGPAFGPAFNLAAYADRSETLKRLIELGVQLHRIEQSRSTAEFILRLDFERHIKPHLLFLNDHGVLPVDWGHFVSEYPMVFDETLTNLEIRIKYLKSKRFTKKEIAYMLNTYPKILSKNVVELDGHLGFLQTLFVFSGNHVRQITINYPNLVDVHKIHFRHTHFSLKEEMGFSGELMRAIVVKKPQILGEVREKVVPRFDLIHNEIGIPHELVAKFPQVLLEKSGTLRERHLYLKKLKRDQYDPRKPGYVPLSALTSDVNEITFASDYCKTSLPDFNAFLKTL